MLLAQDVGLYMLGLVTIPATSELIFGENSPSRIIHEAPRPRRARARARARPSLEQHGRRKLGDAIDLLGLQELLRGLS